MKTKSAVIFDLLGVILDEEKIASKRLYEFVSKRSNISSEELKERYAKGLKIGAISHEEFWSFLDGDWKANEKSFLDDLKFIEGAEKTIRSASEKSDIYLLSEIPRRWAEYVLRRMGVMEVFKEIFVSDDYQLTKKDKQLFEIVDKKIGDIPKTYVDDKSDNLIFPKEIKWRVIWFSRIDTEEDNQLETAKSMGQLSNLL